LVTNREQGTGKREQGTDKNLTNYPLPITHYQLPITNIVILPQEYLQVKLFERGDDFLPGPKPVIVNLQLLLQ